MPANVLIVESAAKARTLQKYLGRDWSVLATGGHVETLPHDRRKHGRDAGKAYWANRAGELPSPPWVWTERGEEALEDILAKAGEDATFYIATDPDREGEFIAWSLDRRLEGHGTRHRVTFEEVTEEAVRAALEQPRPVDARRVESALVRKFLDRLVGYRASKMASAFVPGTSASMGRVQTPTLGFVVERELEREAHVPIPYFEVRAAAEGVDLEVRFHETDDPDAWRNEAGKVDPSRTFDGDLAESARAAIEDAGEVEVRSLDRRERRRKPDAPLSTDALLQAAGSRFGWSPRKTSALASALYEAGHITYIRTDSTRLAASAVQKAREVVKGTFGEDHLGREMRQNVASGPVQDAHEAVRPTRLEVAEVDLDDDDARKIYRLIRAHTLASQMAPSVRSVVSVEAAAEGLERPLTGSISWRTFAGWEAAYAEFLGDTATAPPDIPLEEGAVWTLDPGTEERPNPLLIEDETRPPSRYRPHTLIRAMKEAGIGRPSTYSSTLDKLEERGYVEMEEGALAPTETGRIVWCDVAPLYARESEDGGGEVELFSADFTAGMEERLDRIAAGEVPAPAAWEEWRDRIRDLHESAREQKAEGRSTLSQQRQLEDLLANPASRAVVPDPDGPEGPRPLAELSHGEAREWVRKLRDAGVEPVPSEKQMDYLRSLMADLELDEDELQELTGHRTLEEIGTRSGASAAIEELKRLHDEQRPASRKQRGFIESLVKDAGLDEPQALALVGASSMDDLTGGREGTASALIEALKERTEGGS